MNSAPSAVRLDSVDFAYRRHGKRVSVLESFSLDVLAGEHVGLVGRSGSGKSTVLSLVDGRAVPDRGSVLTLGHALAPLSDGERAELRLRHIAHVFQDFRLLPRYTATQNVALVLELRGTPRIEARERARTVLDRVGLGHRLDHRPPDLSGGEQQRVGIARAVVGQPEILLADEPTGALDTGLRDEILSLLLEVCASATLLLVTHDPAVADRLDRQIAVGVDTSLS